MGLQSFVDRMIDVSGDAACDDHALGVGFANGEATRPSLMS